MSGRFQVGMVAFVWAAGGQGVRATGSASRSRSPVRVSTQDSDRTPKAAARKYPKTAVKLKELGQKIDVVWSLADTPGHKAIRHLRMDNAKYTGVLVEPGLAPTQLNQGSRQVVRIAATRNPTQEWTAQQLRNATMENFAPRFLIRDRDEKFGSTFDRVAQGAGTRVIKTAVRAPNMNPVGERFVGSLRREALDHEHPP